MFDEVEEVRFGIDLLGSNPSEEIVNALYEIFDILELGVGNLFVGEKEYPKGVYRLKEDWREVLRKLYDVTSDSWQPYLDLNSLQIPFFDVFTRIGEDFFVRVTSKPTEMTTSMKTPEYLKLERQRDAIVKQKKATNPDDYEKHVELSEKIVKLNVILCEMEKALLYGPLIDRKAFLEPLYSYEKPGETKVYTSIHPPTEGIRLPRNLPYWNELKPEYRSEATQKLQTLYNQLLTHAESWEANIGPDGHRVVNTADLKETLPRRGKW
jgi:hypothetical protein